MVLLLESLATVTACVSSRFIQIDVHLRMAEGRIGTAIAADNPLRRFDDWRFVNHFNGPVGVYHLGCIYEAGISVVASFVELSCVRYFILNHGTATGQDLRADGSGAADRIRQPACRRQ
uniref:Putative secreted protein n=1 Tax=Anopheles marajoara TaxID=58244 RepID=A0A2M4C7A2_9DIPT